MVLNYFHQVLAQNTAGGAGAAVGVSIFMLIVLGIVVLGSIFVIWMLIDCLTSSMPTNEKILWVLVIIFLHLLGAILYFVVKRSSRGGAAGA